MSDREELWIWMQFYSTPHPICQCWFKETHEFQSLPFLLTCSLCVSNRRVKNRKILFTVRELKENREYRCFICVQGNGILPWKATLLRDIYLQTAMWLLGFGSDLIILSGIMTTYWEWSAPLQDLPLVTSKCIFKPHSSLECTRVANERQAEWRKSFHSNKKVVFPNYFSHQKVLYTFPKGVEVWLEMNWWHCLFLQYRNLECNTIFYP